MQPPSSRRWIFGKVITGEVDQELAAYPPVIRQILFNRNITDAVQAIRYMEGRAEPNDPFLLTDMREAVDRLNYALDHGEKIAVYGDFDVDGVTSTALMVEVIQALGGQVIPYIPDRFEEGYGLNCDALDTLAGSGVQVVLTVDCGIRSIIEAEHANSLAIDLIISDHHHPAEKLPDAYAVICQKREGDEYPEKNLAGVGLAYKIAQALISRRPQGGLAAEHWLDLVALGTVADMVPLTGENRLLVRKGLHRLRLGQRQGILSLASAARINLSQLTTSNIGFGLAPRLNAAGRLESAKAALDLLVSTDVQKSGLLAQKLDDQNSDRQKMTKEHQAVAEQQLLESVEEYILFALDSSFNAGLVGLVASKLVETYYRPAIVATVMEDGGIRASCRSINEFHITRALDECADLMVRHGGHSLAAGFTVRPENLGELRERLEKIAWRELAAVDLRPVVRIDAEVKLEELHPSILDYLEMLQPTGQNNPDAVFCSRNLKVRNPKQVGDKTHLKLTVTDEKYTFDAIAFRFGHLFNNLPNRIDIAFSFEKNVFNGRESLQLRIMDIQPSVKQR